MIPRQWDNMLEVQQPLVTFITEGPLCPLIAKMPYDRDVLIPKIPAQRDSTGEPKLDPCYGCWAGYQNRPPQIYAP